MFEAFPHLSRQALSAYVLWKRILQTTWVQSDCSIRSSLVRVQSICIHDNISLDCICMHVICRRYFLDKNNVCGMFRVSIVSRYIMLYCWPLCKINGHGSVCVIALFLACNKIKRRERYTPKEGIDQKSIQSSACTTPDPEHHVAKKQSLHNTVPAGDHKAARNRQDSITKTNTKH